MNKARSRAVVSCSRPESSGCSWDQPPADLPAIRRIPRQVSEEHLLLVPDAAGDDEGIDQHHQKREERAQDEGHGQEQQQGRHVHGVADQAVEARIHQLLPLLHLHRAGQVGVLLQHEGVEHVPEQKQHRTQDADPVGEPEPSETEAEARQHEGGYEHEAGEEQHVLLGHLLLPGVQPPPEPVRVPGHQKEARQEHGHEQHPHEEPALPESQRARRQKDQRPHQQDARKKLAHGLSKQGSRHGPSRSYIFCCHCRTLSGPLQR